MITEEPKINSMQDDDERLRDGYPTGCTVTESYLRILLSNKIGNANPLTSDWMSVFTLSKVLYVVESWSTPVPYDFGRLRQVVWNDELHAALGTSIRNRRLIILSNEYMGLAPVHTQVGDVVCVFSGATYPSVLRPAGDSFKFVGQCCVHGVMDGELFWEGSSFNQSSVQDITLYL